MGTVALCEICQFQKSTAPHPETPLLTVSLWDSSWSGQIWHALPSTCHLMSAGGCRGIFGQAHGRQEPLCHTCKKGNNYVQRYSASLAHTQRASSLLKSSSLKSVSVFLLVVGCVGTFHYEGWEFSVGFLLCTVLNIVGFSCVCLSFCWLVFRTRTFSLLQNIV